MGLFHLEYSKKQDVLRKVLLKALSTYVFAHFQTEAVKLDAV